MNITGNNSIQNNIFDGSYSIGITGSGSPPFNSADPNFWSDNNINPTGITGTPVYFQSGNVYIDSGYQITGFGTSKGIATGLSAMSSSVSGYVYYRINTPIYGLCHGVGDDANSWYMGYNFYNGFHQEGYFAPPFGQNLSVYIQNQDGTSALAEDGSCANLTTDEYNDMFGICTQLDNFINDSTDSATAFINSPSIACPQDLSVTFYWHEVQYNLIAGTAAAISANSFYNSNPIPTALDNFSIKTTKRYSTTTTPLTGTYQNGDGTSSPEYLNTINYTGGKPIPAYPTSGGYNILDNLTCPGIPAEGSLADQIVSSQLLDDPDTLETDALGNFDVDNWWHIWHFLYEENSDGFPFQNGYDNQGNNVGVARTTDQSNVGSQLFEYELSNSDDYWNRRQCAEAINFLPHTFGASIFACPSYYFDIPYYAALKKFGFYGTRFLDGCVSLEFGYDSTGESYYGDLDLPATGYSYTTPGDSEPAPDAGTNGTFATYTNLLRVAAAEEKQTDFYALNKLLFLWANSGLITGTAQYQSLCLNTGFSGIFNGMFGQYNSAFPNGTGDLINLNNNLFTSGTTFTFYNTGNTYSFLGDNSQYIPYYNDILKTFSNSNDAPNWQFIENNYGVAVLQSAGVVAADFYNQLATGKQIRLQNRYFENYINGNPIDLFPTNKIYFSYDQAGGYINGSGWGKSPGGGYGSHASFNDTGLSKRFFLGAYNNGENISGIQSFINNTPSITNSAFYPGYFNSNIGSEFPSPSFTPVITGWSGSSGNFSPIEGGFFALGYNGIGALKSNFSCFTPIFIQQPFNKTYCKIGQSATFRALAVDYHTIPEDKINIRYPEIVYWTTQLKTVDENYNNLYPLAYKWYRILKSDCFNPETDTTTFQNFLLNPDFSLLSPSNPSGDWCALEGDGPYCTLIHPQQCIPPFSNNGSWAYSLRNTPMYEQAKRNNFYMTFKQGAIKGTDDQYYYFCMVKGRFGIRISEPSELFIEDWLAFDLSIQNGGNVSMAPPSVVFKGNVNGENQTITCNSTSVSSYDGFQRNNDFIPEDVIQEQIPPPNAGYGDVYSWKFIGMWGYGGTTQTYSPGTLDDTRGLKQDWGRMLHYGSLKQYYSSLNQDQGNLLYGTNHLPSCVSGAGGYSMPAGQQGVKVSVDGGYVHWANMQMPLADTNGNYGVLWSELGNAGELYVPSEMTTNGGNTTISPGLGQWQWGNNLGTIHNFGWNSNILLNSDTPNEANIDNGDVASTPYQLSTASLTQLKSQLLRGGVLGGKNCGWQRYGLGRNMLYWIEGFSSFYLYCDNLKKKNVQNLNYMNPGLRQTNSSMQYFWLGKPSNSYLDRYPLFGPYAYEWKVGKHNRDRNGNGFSEGFYSYGWNGNYTQQYDAPAIYGLFIKYKNRSDTTTLASINAGRSAVFGTNLQGVTTTRFGFIANADQEGIVYGDIFLGVLDDNTSPTANYVVSGETNASAQQTQLYGCSDADLAAGKCFDPCLSMRYQFGFLPGGKRQGFSTSYPNGSGYNLVPNSIVVNGNPAQSTTLGADDTAFRGAFGTPHLKYLKTALGDAGITLLSQELNGFGPCFDGGADHCNYITPTLNIGSSMYLEQNSANWMSNANLAAQSVNL